MKVGSSSSALSFSVRRATSAWANAVHDTGLATGSRPRLASSGTSSASRSVVTTNASAACSGSAMRSCPPWVNDTTSIVSLAVSSLGAARSIWPVVPMSTTISSPLSSVNTSSDPLRSTLLILVPSTRLWNALRDPLRWTAFATGTSTDLTRRLTVSRSRPRRSVSISGSSGIFALQLGHEGGVGVTRRDLFGLLLGPALAGPAGDAADRHGHVEAAGVVGAFGQGLVLGGLVEASGRQLLEAALVVLAAGPTGVRLRDPAAEQPQHEVVGLAHAGRHVDRAEHGLERVGQDRRLLAAAGLLLALAEQQVVAEVELVGHLGQRDGVDGRLAAVGQLALAEPGVGVEGMVGDDGPEHRVAEELEPFVGVVAGVLRTPRPVDERGGEHLGGVERDAEAHGQLIESWYGKRDDRAF